MYYIRAHTHIYICRNSVFSSFPVLMETPFLVAEWFKQTLWYPLTEDLLTVDGC